MTNPVIECLKAHRSIRKFTDKPIEPETLDLILEAGTRAATAGNLQHYSFIVVDDPAKKRELFDDEVVDNPICIIAVVDEYRLKRWLELSDAPFYLNQASNLFIGYWDAVIALQNVVVAAESLGLGTVYIGAVLSMDLNKLLGTPEYVFPAGMVWLGHPDESPELRPRMPLEGVVHRNGYRVVSDEEIKEYYRFLDERWEQMPEKVRKEFEEKGIHNMGQVVTLGHYTEEFISGESAAILDLLKKSGFRLEKAEKDSADR